MIAGKRGQCCDSELAPETVLQARDHNTMRFIARASAAVVILATALNAGPATAQSYDGSGLVRFGIFGQGTWVGADVVETSVPAVPPPPVEEIAGSASINGLGFGLSAGFDQRFGHWLLGAEIDWTYLGNSTWYLGNRYTADWMATARGRLGGYIHPGWLIYGTAGLAALGIESDAPASRDTATTRFGFTIGAGTEVAWHHVVLFAEYLYADLDRWGYYIGADHYRVDTDAHVLRLGLKFNVGHDYYHDDVAAARRR